MFHRYTFVTLVYVTLCVRFFFVYCRICCFKPFLLCILSTICCCWWCCCCLCSIPIQLWIILLQNLSLSCICVSLLFLFYFSKSSLFVPNRAFFFLSVSLSFSHSSFFIISALFVWYYKTLARWILCSQALNTTTEWGTLVASSFHHFFFTCHNCVLWDSIEHILCINWIIHLIRPIIYSKPEKSQSG